MPATSEKQKNFMKMVLAHKDGKLDMSKFSDAMKERIKDAAKSMTKKELHDFVDAPVKEGVLNELSKDTLKAYAKKAVPDMQKHEQEVKKSLDKANAELDKGHERKAEKHLADANKSNEKMKSRMAGLAGAVKRFTKEEAQDITFSQYLELINEMSSCEDEEIGFKKLQAKIEAQGKSPEAAAAIAASVGRKKYGKKKFQAMAAAGKK